MHKSMEVAIVHTWSAENETRRRKKQRTSVSKDWTQVEVGREKDRKAQKCGEKEGNREEKDGEGERGWERKEKRRYLEETD